MVTLTAVERRGRPPGVAGGAAGGARATPRACGELGPGCCRNPTSRADSSDADPAQHTQILLTCHKGLVYSYTTLLNKILISNMCVMMVNRDLTVVKYVTYLSCQDQASRT